MSESYSALILPWIDKHTSIKLSINISCIWILSFEVLLIHIWTENNCFIKNLIRMEILISSLREIIFLHTRMGAVFVIQHLLVKAVCFSSARSVLLTNHVLSVGVIVTETSLREIVVSQLRVLIAHNLWFCAKILFLILREVVNRPFIFMKSAQILVIIRILMIIKCVHSFVSSIHCL